MLLLKQNIITVVFNNLPEQLFYLKKIRRCCRIKML